MSKHTPGPWRLRLSDTDRARPIPADVHGDDGCFVADCGSHDASDANANLIAAAPDLLEALKVCVTTHDALVSWAGKSDPPAIAKARAAIAKAGTEVTR